MQTNTSSKFSGKTLCIGEALIDMICTDYGKKLSEGNNFLKRRVELLPMWQQLFQP